MRTAFTDAAGSVRFLDPSETQARRCCLIVPGDRVIPKTPEAVTDTACPHCAALSNAIDLARTDRDPGKQRVRYRDHVANAFAPKGASAALFSDCCVVQQQSLKSVLIS